MRMALVDPVLAAVALTALPGFVMGVRKWSAAPVLLLCWLASLAAASLSGSIATFRTCCPWRRRWRLWPRHIGGLFQALGAGDAGVSWRRVVAKAVAPAAPSGLSFQRGTVQADAPLLSGYCQRARGNELILVGMDDDLYASTLPLAKLRHCLVGANLAGGQSAWISMAWGGSQGRAIRGPRPMGAGVPKAAAGVGTRFRRPIGTLILAGSPEEGADIRAHPASDFLLPKTVPRGGRTGGAADPRTGGSRG